MIEEVENVMLKSIDFEIDRIDILTIESILNHSNKSIQTRKTKNSLS